LWLALWGCGGGTDPVQELSRDLSQYPEFSLLLDDLRVEDGFFADCYLRFKAVTASGQRVDGRDTLVYEERQTAEYKVSRDVFARYEHHLGMVVASKTLDGRATDSRQAYPPGYQYVGNPQYGHWNSAGIWEFLGPYMLMQQMMGGWRVNQADYGEFRRAGERGRPYYGPVREGRTAFGTGGSLTEKARPEFYQRQVRRLGANRKAFAAKSASRMGRGTGTWGRGFSRLGGRRR
jgi:hypothetical protein